MRSLGAWPTLLDIPREGDNPPKIKIIVKSVPAFEAQHPPFPIDNVVGEPVCATSLNLVPSREEIAHALMGPATLNSRTVFIL